MKLLAFVPVFISAITAPTFSSASDNNCTEPPAHLVSPVDDLIERSTRIVRVKYRAFPSTPEAERINNVKIDTEREKNRATESDGEPERITSALALAKFDVIEDIKGEGPPHIYLMRAPDDTSRQTDAFDQHQKTEFWEDNQLGRIKLNANCQIALTFEEDASYLIFQGAPHVKAYERVDTEDDAWLTYVRDALAN